MKKILSLLILVFYCSINSSNAQIDVIMNSINTGQTFNTCGGTFFDEGGQPGTGYLNNSNYTVVICPDVPGDAITLDFITFNLSNTNTAAPPGNNADNMTIYDGNTTGAPTLGTYGGNQLQGLLVGCTSFNTSGCLTIVFNSNSAGLGFFAASITCTTPCQRPIAALSAPTSQQLKICQGESVTFNGSPSTAAAGFNIETYLWDFWDGTLDSTSGPIVSHVFNDEGEYLVDLYLFDDNDCASTNRVTIQVLVSTTPTFVGTSGDTTICLGEFVCLDGVVNPVTYTGMPQSNLGGATYLPDDVGQCFESTIDFNSFAPGQTLNNINDLFSICVNMEHSYIGDLVASITCPDGTQVILYQQGGGWNSLGEPIDISGPNDPPGVGYPYCWAPNAPLGTWAQCGNAGATPNIITLPNGIPTLAPGTYSSLNPLSDLVGCPLNGVWTLEFCDLWGADDGWVFDWQIDFNPAIFPSITQFTPVFGNNCDSSSWTGVNGAANAIITSTSPDCNQICVTPTAAGTYQYVYSATDDFGCTYDTTITITVTTPPVPDAGPDLIACPNVPIQIDANVGNTGTTCNYTIQMHDSYGDGWNSAFLTVTINGVPTDYTMAFGYDQDWVIPIPAGATFDFTYTPGFWESEVTYEILDCNGNVVFSDGPFPAIGSVYSGMNGLDMVLQWTPAAGLSNTTIEDPMATVNAPTTYYLTIYENGHPLCAQTDSMQITIDPAVFAGSDGVNTVCYNDPAFNMFNFLGGAPSVAGAWFDNAFTATSNMFNVNVFPAGGTFYYIVPGNGGCPADTAQVVVTVLGPNDPLCCSIVFNSSFTNVNCNAACDGTISITTTSAGNQFSIDGGVTYLPDSTFTGLCAGIYNLSIIGISGCVVTGQVTISEPTALTVNVTTNNNVSCFGGTNGQLTAAAAGGTLPYSYLWDDNCNQTTSICGTNCVPAGNYCVTVTDGNGCTVQDCDIVTEPTQLTINFLPVDASCFGSCDGNATVIPNGGTTPYSYNWYGIAGTSSSTTQANNLCAGSYDLTVTDANGCPVDTLNFIINQPVQLAIQSISSVDETCFGLCDGSISITSANGVSFSINNGTTFSPSGNFANLCTGTYEVVVQDINGCQVASTATVSGPPDVVAFFGASPQPASLFTPTVNFVNMSTGAISYSWDFDGLGTSTLTNPTFIFPNDSGRVYYVCLAATNSNGCTDTFCQDIVINEEFVFYAPNSFTPDGNGINDVFFVYGNDIDPAEFDLFIFNRWGEIIFTSESLTSGWDGTFKGRDVKNDVYVWKVKTRSLATEKYYERIGHVTLVR